MNDDRNISNRKDVVKIKQLRMAMPLLRQSDAGFSQQSFGFNSG
jgi:hypothetical protein